MEKLFTRTPFDSIVKVPTEYWEDLVHRDMRVVCDNTHARIRSPGSILLPFLGEDLLVDCECRCLRHFNRGSWEVLESPLLELLCLVYLLHAGPESLCHEMISVQELRDAHFFQGPHQLEVRPLLQRYGQDTDAFKRVASGLGGEALELADAAYKIWVFPKVPIYYLLWKGDQEFEPRLSILFDRSIEHHLSADAIWGLANLVSDILLKGYQNSEE